MEFASYEGTVELGDGFVRITKGKKDAGRTIPLSDIVSVSVIKPSMGSAGCIHVQVIGARVHSQFETVMSYTGDMNAVCFRKPQYAEALQFKDAIDQALVTMKKDTKAQGAVEIPPGMVVSVVEEIRGLKALMDEGILTKEEFGAKKKQLLGI